MKTTFGEGFVFRALRWSGCVLAVAALALGAAAVGRAQTPSGGANSAPKASAPAAQKAAKPSGESGGMNTGIKVHGHWTINILTKDGKLVSHHEFENNLAYGAPILSNLLGGTATMGGVAILLGGSACPSLYPVASYGQIGLFTLPGFPGVCPIVVANSAMAASNPSSSQYRPYVGFLTQQVSDIENYDLALCHLVINYDICSPTLNVTSLPGTSSSYAAPSLTLSGSYSLTSYITTGSITGVAATGYVCSASVTSSTCVTQVAQGSAVPVLDIYAIIPTSGGGTVSVEGDTLAITSTTISPGIPVGAGQTIQATVVISFSGSD